jgi:phosphatidylserine decarboxylase
MRDGLILSFLSVLPRGLVSRAMGAGTRIALPRALHRSFLRWYCGHYGVNLGECEDPGSFPTIASFFVRALRDGARPVDAAPDALVSPVDAKVYALGDVTNGRLPQSPELDYAVADLLGGDKRYEGGTFAVLYLAPKDYHRVHAPREGRVLGVRYRPGELWPVFPGATRRIRDLFARNERLVVRLDTDRGEIAVVMVGAFGVGRMSLAFDSMVTNTGRPGTDAEYTPPKGIGRAEEIGRFEMGSTVVLVLPRAVTWTVSPGQDVKLGQAIGRFAPT